MRLSGPVAFNIMLKPAGSLCNLDCHYCYYLDKAEIYGGREPRMSLDMLETVVSEYIRANDVPEVTFNWHGGEPLILGLDFYRKALEFEQQYADGKIIHNTLQTNGTLLTEEWAGFLARGGFLVGISLDGPAAVHDRYRKDKGGAPTFEKVMRGVRLLQRAGVEFNTMSTVNKASEGRGKEVYRFLKEIGSHYMQFMPVVEHIRYPLDGKGKPMKFARPYIVDPAEEGASLAPWSVGDIAYGKFLCDIFDEWVRHDVGEMFVNVFDATLAGWMGVAPGICVYAEECGHAVVMEHNGDVYSCDHFVFPQYRLGNILTDGLPQMVYGEKQTAFSRLKKDSLPRQCRACEWLKACHGECPRLRFLHTADGEPGLNYLCAGYKIFFQHVAPYMDFMRNELLAGRPASGVMTAFV